MSQPAKKIYDAKMRAAFHYSREFAFAAAICLCVFGANRLVAQQPVTLYDPDPEHLWNRIHRALVIRTSASGKEFNQKGYNALLWPRSTHLLHGHSRDQALSVLSEFRKKDGGDLVRDPVQRAIFQHSLWSVFDWAADPNGAHRPDGFATAAQELSLAVGLALTQVTLNAEQIRTLPDTYRATVASGKYPGLFNAAHPNRPYLPPDFFAPEGPWICLGEPVVTQGRTFHQLVPRHVDEFSRSSFAVFLSIPGGRAAGLAFLEKLNRFGSANGERSQMPALTNVPALPVGTEFALLRSALVISNTGELVPTRVVESLQIRRVHESEDAASQRTQIVQEFVLNRSSKAGRSGIDLRALEKDERGFREFNDLADAFEPQGAGRHEEPDLPVVLQTCSGCHHDPGIRGFNTYTRSFSSQGIRPPTLIPSTASEREQAAIYWKQTRYDWGLFIGLLKR